MSSVAAIHLGPLARLPDLAALLVPGRVLVGSVLERRGDHGLLLLAGRPLVAQLPPDVEAGSRLRLRVALDGSARAAVTLQVLGDAPPPAAAPAATAPPPIAVPMPDGGRLVVLRDGEAVDGAPGPGTASVSLRYDAPGLGRVDLRISGSAVAVHLPAGTPAALARSAAPELSAALGGLAVTVHPREGTVDRRA